MVDPETLSEEGKIIRSMQSTQCEKIKPGAIRIRDLHPIISTTSVIGAPKNFSSFKLHSGHNRFQVISISRDFCRRCSRFSSLIMFHGTAENQGTADPNYSDPGTFQSGRKGWIDKPPTWVRHQATLHMPQPVLMCGAPFASWGIKRELHVNRGKTPASHALRQNGIISPTNQNARPTLEQGNATCGLAAMVHRLFFALAGA